MNLPALLSSTTSVSRSAGRQARGSTAVDDQHVAVDVGGAAKRYLQYEKTNRAPIDDTKTPRTVPETETVVSSLPNRGEALARQDKQERSLIIAEWEGQVEVIAETYFVAQLRGLYGDGVAGVTEEATIPKSDLQDDDGSLLREGAFFRLCISYSVSPQGRRRRFTEVVFRRMPAYSAHALQQARERARELRRGLRLD